MKKHIPISFLITFLLVITFSCSRNQENSGIQNIETINAKKNLKSDSLLVFDTIAGKKVYESKCMVCHQENGLGVTGTFPPLAGSDYLLFDKKRALKNIIHGAKDSIVVNGQTYRGNIMPDIELTDEQIKDVANYILNSWGNKGGIVSIEDVRSAQNK